MPTQDADEVIKDVGRRIAELRIGLNLTQEQLAERLGIDTNNLQRIETGRQNLTLRTLVRLASAVESPVATLFAAPASREVKIGRPPSRSKD